MNYNESFNNSSPKTIDSIATCNAQNTWNENKHGLMHIKNFNIYGHTNRLIHEQNLLLEMMAWFMLWVVKVPRLNVEKNCLFLN